MRAPVLDICNNAFSNVLLNFGGSGKLGGGLVVIREFLSISFFLLVEGEVLFVNSLFGT